MQNAENFLVKLTKLRIKNDKTMIEDCDNLEIEGFPSVIEMFYDTFHDIGVPDDIRGMTFYDFLQIIYQVFNKEHKKA